VRTFLIPLFALTTTITSLASDEIYADFTVSHGATPLGTFRARLDYDKVPRTCANFIGLASGQRPWIDLTTGAVQEGKPYYDGITFHRLIHSFMIQGGSPNGNGTDGPGFSIQDEFDGSLRHSGPYKLSMAKSSLPGSGGSQFFITLSAPTHLDDKHSVFGEVISGTEIIDSFANATLFPTGTSDKPLTPITMTSVVVSGPGLANFDINSPTLGLPHVQTENTSPLVPSQNVGTSTFTISFDRSFQTEYLSFYTTNLSSWTPLTRTISVNASPDYDFKVNGVTFDRFFMRLPSVDYSEVINAPSDLAKAGASLAITSRSGETITLDFTSSSTGTWTDSNGGSGTLTSLVWTDFIPEAGAGGNTAGLAPQLPLGRLTATFSSPAGLGAWTTINIILSFHTPNSGWTDGTANNSQFNPILRAFSYTP
jgi:peptidyl-prolyl cis-trans isomerase A (cyclophilin A)